MPENLCLCLPALGTKGVMALLRLMLLRLMLLPAVEMLSFTHAKSPSARSSRESCAIAERYCSCARTAIHRNRLPQARYAYYEALSRVPDPAATEPLLLRLALLEQRSKNFTGSRDVFKSAIRICPWSDKLFCAWGLFESKQGLKTAAISLLEHSVYLNPANSPVLKWKVRSDSDRLRQPQPSIRLHFANAATHDYAWFSASY